MDMDRYIGKLLDNRYEILEVIGTGGMAVVYKARCHRLNRLVAVKILKDENLQDEDFRRRFHTEGQTVGMLSHPNIVSVYDVSKTDDADYIVMELIDGISLKQYMEKKQVLNWKETLHFGTQIAKGLEHAHSRGLVHRDIKPHNVMVMKNGAVRVADFGIARVMSNSHTLTKETLGSVHYISPEQARGAQVDHRSDIYSLGVVMYEMITGQTPYDGESPVSVAIQHISGNPMPPSSINPSIPKGLEQIIMKAMAHDLRMRYPNAAAMLADMDEFRKDPTIVFSAEHLTGVAPKAEPAEEKAPQGQSGAGEYKPPMPFPETTARQTAQRKKKQPRERDYVDEEISRGRIATAAVIICSLTVVVAVLIFLGVLVFGGNASMEKQMVEVPSLVGIDFEQLPNYDQIKVVKQLEAYSSEYGAGKIINQLPEAGERVEKGRTVYVTVSLGPKPADQKMIDMTNYTKAEVTTYLDSLNLSLNYTFKADYHDTVPADKVVSTEPAAGQVLRKGQKITIVISLGREPQYAEMPDFLRGTYTQKSDAESIMNSKGFANVEWVEVNSLLPKGTVVSQSVPAGTSVDVTTHIVIEYSNEIPPEKSPVTISYTISDLPEEGEIAVAIYSDEENRVVTTVKKQEGETSVTVELTGNGTKTYTVFIDGEGQEEKLVIDFDSYGE